MSINNFGVQLKYYLEKHRINKAAFARDLEISPQALQSLFKTENHGVNTIQKILKILNVSHDEFYEINTTSEPTSLYETKKKQTIEVDIDDYKFFMNAVKERDELKNREIERLKIANRANQPETH